MSWWPASLGGEGDLSSLPHPPEWNSHHTELWVGRRGAGMIQVLHTHFLSKIPWILNKCFLICCMTLGQFSGTLSSYFLHSFLPVMAVLLGGGSAECIMWPLQKWSTLECAEQDWIPRSFSSLDSRWLSFSWSSLHVSNSLYISSLHGSN